MRRSGQIWEASAAPSGGCHGGDDDGDGGGDDDDADGGVLTQSCRGPDPYDALVIRFTTSKQTNRHSSCLGSECIYVSMINLQGDQVQL